MKKESSLRNENLFSFLMNDMKKAVVETLAVAGVNASLAKETRVSSSVTVQQAKLALKGLGKCKAGFLTGYFGGPYIGLSMTKMLAYMDTKNDAAIIFIDKGTVYAVPLSSMRGMKDGVNMWAWIMADRNVIKNVTGIDGVSASMTLADPEKLKQLALLSVSMPDEVRKKYEAAVAEYEMK